MKMSKNEAIVALTQRLMDQRLKPMIDKASSMDHTIKPIPVNKALYENDYVEYIARKNGQLKHIHCTKDNK